MTGFNSKREASYAKLNNESTIVHYKESSDKVPKCFNSVVEWKDWQKIAKVVNPGINGYCTDCTFKYKNKMIKENRCNYPTVKFKLVADGGVEGVREKLWFKKPIIPLD